MKSILIYSRSMRSIFLLCFLFLCCASSYATSHTIQVASFSFTPQSTNAQVGDTIVFMWVSGSHTTTSISVPPGAASWNSPMNSANTTFMYVITKPGTYNFHCSIHTIMTGSINATAVVIPTTQFQAGYGMSDSTSDAAGSCVQQTFDGGFISTGYISNFGGGQDDFYLVKTDANGVVEWTKSYGGSGPDDANYVIQTADSGYAVVGPSFSYGGQTILLIKTDANGTALWSKTYGTGDSLSDVSASSFKQTADGGYIITGYISNFGGGGDDFYLVKTDASGNLTWAKSYGSAGEDDANSIGLTNDGGYIIAGTTTSFGDPNGDIYLLKTDSTGNIQWSRDFGSSNGADMANSVQQTADNGYIIGGVTLSPTFGEFATLIKTDNNGQMVWTKAYGIDSSSSDVSASSVVQTADGGYALTGYVSNFGAGDDDYVLIKTNATGDLQWANAYGSSGADDALFIQQTTDGGYVLSGKTFGFAVSGLGQHLYVVKTDSSGNAPCNQFSTGIIADDSITFSLFSTIDSVSSGGVATVVTPVVSSGGVAADLCSTVTGVKELSSSMEVQVYPNPSSGQFQVSSSKFIQNLEIYNMMGERIYSAEVNSNRMELDLKKEASGIYFVRIFSGKEIDIKRIVINN